MGNGALPNGPSYRAHPRLYQSGCWRSGKARLLCPGISGINLFRYCRIIVYFDAKIPARRHKFPRHTGRTSSSIRSDLDFRYTQPAPARQRRCPWSFWTIPRPIPGPHLVYGFLTTVPNAVVEPIHPKAMPVILTSDEERDVWMRATVG